MGPERNLGPLAARGPCPPGLKESHVRKNQEKTSFATERKSGLGLGGAKPRVARVALPLALQVLRENHPGSIFWAYPQRAC